MDLVPGSEVYLLLFQLNLSQSKLQTCSNSAAIEKTFSLLPQREWSAGWPGDYCWEIFILHRGERDVRGLHMVTQDGKKVIGAVSSTVAPQYEQL